MHKGALTMLPYSPVPVLDLSPWPLVVFVTVVFAVVLAVIKMMPPVAMFTFLFLLMFSFEFFLPRRQNVVS